jgi:protein gp37
MSKETKIEWADSTLNFWSGCTKVSTGCAKCYAEVLSKRGLRNKAGELNIGQWGKGAPRKRHQSAFNLAFQLNKKPWVCDFCGNAMSYEWLGHCTNPKCTGNPPSIMAGVHRRRVFSLSLGDWLDPEVPIEWLAEMLDTVRQCDELQWLLVTKRQELWRERIEAVRDFAAAERWGCLWDWSCSWLSGNPRKRIMVLTSVEDQKAADERIPALVKIPAAQRGLSCEPLLGPVDIAPYMADAVQMLDWVIVGGESGQGARACNVEWIRSIGSQCDAAGVPVFVKQLGAFATAPQNVFWDGPTFKAGCPDYNLVELADKKGGDITEWPEDLRVREFPEVL